MVSFDCNVGSNMALRYIPPQHIAVHRRTHLLQQRPVSPPALAEGCRGASPEGLAAQQVLEQGWAQGLIQSSGRLRK